MSAWEDASWQNTPSYRPVLRNPTFVLEQGLAKEERQIQGGGEEEGGAEAKAWYEQFAAAAPPEPPQPAQSTSGGETENLNQRAYCLFDLYRLAKTTGRADSCLLHLPSWLSASKYVPVPALPSRRPPSSAKSASTNRHKSHRASDPHWFIAHSVAASSSASSDLSSPVPFSLALAAPSFSRPPTPSSLASLLTLPEPGQGPSFRPPAFFHLKPGNKGHDLLVKQGWSGRGLGKGGDPTVGAAVEAKGKSQGVVEKRKPEAKVKKLKLDDDGAIDLTVSSSDEASISSPGSEDESESDSKPPPPPHAYPIKPNASTSSDGRFALIAPLSTTLKPDRLGIRSAESSARHRAVTHTHQEIRAAAKAGAVQEGRLSAKSIRKRVERDRRERLDVMANLR